MVTIEAKDLRLALKALAPVLDRIASDPKDWRAMVPREHLARGVEAADKELTGAMGDDWLAVAAARLLLALQCREFQRGVNKGAALEAPATDQAKRTRSNDLVVNNPDKIILRHSVDRR